MNFLYTYSQFDLENFSICTSNFDFEFFRLGI